MTKEIEINSKVKLKGTLSIPDNNEKLTTIIFINGSGISDRDGNAKGMNLNLYKDLSDYLVSRNFITLRYDKRGVGESEGDANSTGMYDLIEDIKSCIEFSKNQEQSNQKVILLGHSEGCILATLLSKEVKVDGLILLSGAGVCLKEALLYQIRMQSEEIASMKGFKGFLLRLLLTEEKAFKMQNDLFEKFINSSEDIIKIKGKKMPAKWFREHLSITNEDIFEILKNNDTKVLAITGDKDVQTNCSDLENIKELENVETYVIKDMNHILKEYNEEVSLLNVMKQYKECSNFTIHKDLIEKLDNWLNIN